MGDPAAELARSFGGDTVRFMPGALGAVAVPREPPVPVR